VSDAPLVVVGAGIGGLAAALCLAHANKRVLILERAPAIEEVGAGLQISPNAGRVLQRLGLSDAMAACAIEPIAFRIRRAQDGAELARAPLDHAPARWGAPFRVFHRADLQALLLEAARRSGLIDIRTNARVGDFEEFSGAVYLRVHGARGLEDVEAGALVGADGVRSAVRSALVKNGEDAPVYSGCTAWRALIPTQDAPAELRRRETHLWLGRGAHVVHYPLRDASLMSVVAIIETGAPPADEPDFVSGAQLRAREEFSRWRSIVCDLMLAGERWRRWPLFARPRPARWREGAVTLLGDAAHPMLPFLAQGAAQAIEDAEALGVAVAQQSDAARAFDAYQRMRLSRATAIQTASRRQGRILHAGAPLGLARDAAFRLLGKRFLERNDWIYRA
jgi:salicylate hydroxylase